MKQKFKAKLRPEGPGGAWTFVTLPFNVQETWGSRARVAVKGTINGFPFQSSAFPVGDGTHTIMVGKNLQAGGKVKQGEAAEFVLEPDTAPRTVEVPVEFKKLLSKHKQAKLNFEKLSPSHKKAYVEFITQAKKEETRQRRLEKTIEMLAAGKKIM